MSKVDSSSSSKPNSSKSSKSTRNREKAKSASSQNKPAGRYSLEAMIMEGEKILLEADIHWGIYWKAATLMFFSLILMCTTARSLGFVLFLFSVVAFSIAWITKYYLALVLTNKRIITRWGIANLDFVDIRFSQLESAEVSRSIIGRILGFGGVVLSGTGSRVIVVPYVGNAFIFRKRLNEILMKREDMLEKKLSAGDAEVSDA